jgi:AcrR family transcriptional regulator
MTTKERKEREKLARREAILEAAREVFFKNGFQTTTMDQVAEAAELSKGSLYLHFPTKEELYVSLHIEGLELLHERFKKAVQGVEDWETRIRNIGKAYYNFYREEKNYCQILFLLQHGEIAPKVSDDVIQTCFDLGYECLGILCRAIEDGMAQGEIRHQDAMELAIVLWGSLNGVILLHEEEEHKEIIPTTMDRMIQITFSLLIDGLRKR